MTETKKRGLHPGRLQTPKHMTFAITYLHSTMLALMPDVPQTCKAAPPSKNQKCNPAASNVATKRMQTTKASCITAVGVQHFSRVTVVADYLQILANATTNLYSWPHVHCAPNNRLARILTAALWSKRLEKRPAKCRGESGCMQFFGQRLAQTSPELSTFTAISSFFQPLGEDSRTATSPSHARRLSSHAARIEAPLEGPRVMAELCASFEPAMQPRAWPHVVDPLMGRVMLIMMNV